MAKKTGNFVTEIAGKYDDGSLAEKEKVEFFPVQLIHSILIGMECHSMPIIKKYAASITHLAPSTE